MTDIYEVTLSSDLDRYGMTHGIGMFYFSVRPTYAQVYSAVSAAESEISFTTMRAIKQLVDQSGKPGLWRQPIDNHHGVDRIFIRVLSVFQPDDLPAVQSPVGPA